MVYDNLITYPPSELVNRDFIAEAFAIAEGRIAPEPEKMHILELVAALKSFGYGSAQAVEDALLGK